MNQSASRSWKGRLRNAAATSNFVADQNESRFRGAGSACTYRVIVSAGGCAFSAFALSRWKAKRERSVRDRAEHDGRGDPERAVQQQRTGQRDHATVFLGDRPIAR